MSGLGRRTHYRKHLTDSVLHDLPTPSNNESIAKVVSTRGSNQFNVIVAGAGSSPRLAILPSKFNKLIWLKRGDFCIVQVGEEDSSDEEDGGGIRYLITHILYKEQIKHLKSKQLWPKDAEFQTLDGGGDDTEEGDKKLDREDAQQQSDDGIVFDTGVDDEYYINTNRINAMQIQDSSESDSSDDEDDDKKQQGTEDDDEGIVYDTQDDELFANTNRVAALRIEESESESSGDEDEKEKDTGNKGTGNLKEHDEPEATGMSRGATSGSLLYDTADAEEIPDPTSKGLSRADTSESIEFDTAVISDHKKKKGTMDTNTTGNLKEHDEPDTTGMSRGATSGSLLYDTADAEEIPDPSSHGLSRADTSESIEFDTARRPDVISNHDSLHEALHIDDSGEGGKKSMSRADTSDSLVFDTADAEEVPDPSSHHEIEDTDDDDDSSAAIPRTGTRDSLEYDTAANIGIQASTSSLAYDTGRDHHMKEEEHDEGDDRNQIV